MSQLTRRSALKLASAGLAAGWSADATARTPEPHTSVGRWDVFEHAVRGPESGNPFTEVPFAAVFALGHRTVRVEGFYDGGGVYKVRFMPDAEGVWTFRTESNRPELAGHTGSFTVTAARAGVRGPVGVADEFGFAHADGTPFPPFGTTCYAWIHQSDALQAETLRTLAAAPFNKLRMCVFPKHYEYNHNEPALHPFVRDAAGKNDFTQPNPAFFAHLEQRLRDLDALGVQADLILFHPYDRWGYAAMPREADELYLRYLLTRVASMRNVWWSLANEFDLMKAKTTADFDRFFHLVEQYDPYGHLRSIHYSHTRYDYSRPWCTHASLQTAEFALAPEMRRSLRKPVLFDEVQYEGNLNRRWGNISGAELARRFWLGVMQGGYVTHGETLLREDAALDEGATPTLWWSHGGTLHGTSPRAIAFLRKLVEEACAEKGVRAVLEPDPQPYYLNAAVYDRERKTARTVLYYFDDHQPIWYEFPLPEGEFTAEAIDPEKGTITALDGTFRGKAKIRLSGRPFQAMRFRART